MLKRQLCNKLIQENKVKAYDVIRHSYSSSRMKGEMKDIRQNNICPTLDTRCDCLGVVVYEQKQQIPDNESCSGDRREKSDGGRCWYQQDRIYQGDYAVCLTTKNLPWYQVGEMIDSKFYLTSRMKKYITSEDVKYKVNESNLVINRDVACTKTTREGQTRADVSDFILELPDNTKLGVNYRHIKDNPENLRIRKLTPKECFRLMGVRDEDFENVAKNQSKSSLYHLAGDSIVVDVLMAIFKEMV